ncbi:diguanylate cyclase domain-containing protein [Ochrobactrum sp. 19YEA23]|uniref:diguanylate cyclase domain-containing protein n=1 Tax=Ochrobactrum sp. 19YEA23 TaxID=3039854 RepID=UPI00370964D0
MINRPWRDRASPYPSVSQLFSSQKIAITVSFGIAEYQGHDRKLLLLAADKALYSAKNAGRSRIFVSIGSQLIADVAVLHMHTVNYALRHPFC